MDHFEFKKITEIKDRIENFFTLEKLQELKGAISQYLERTHDRVEAKFDGEMKKALRDTFRILDRARKEIEAIQKSIVSVLRPGKKKASKRSASGKSKKRVMPKKKVASQRSAQAH